MFVPGGSTDRLWACLFLGGWHALLCGEVFVWTSDGTQGWSVVWQKGDLKYHFPREMQAIRYTECIAVDRCYSAATLFRGSRKSQTTCGYESCRGERMTGNIMEQGA